MTSRDHHSQRCSFCNKPRLDVKTLVAGPEAFICDECVDICNDIIAQGTSDDGSILGVFETRHFGPLVRCRLCQTLYAKEQCVAVPDRGWLCAGCLVFVRQLLRTASETPK
jgi:hypothetical protein